MNRECTVKRVRHPKEKAGLLSLFTFAYTIPLFAKGYKKDLEENDMYHVMHKLRANHVGNKLETHWNKEKEKRKNPSILNALIACFGITYIFMVLFQFIVLTSFLVLKPWVMKKFISYFTIKETTMTKLEASYFGYALVFINFFEYAIMTHYYFYEQEYGIRVTKALSSLIYRKALKLDTSELNETSTGKVLTVLSKDVENIRFAIHALGGGAIAVVHLGVLFYLVFASVGNAALIGFALIILWCPMQGMFGKWIYVKRIETNKATDKRLQITKEFLSSIRILKMYVWENYFVKMLLSVRDKELKCLRHAFFLNASTYCMAQFIAKVSTLIIFKSYTWLGHIWTADLIYYVISCFEKFIFTIGVKIPWNSNRLANLMVSVNRINKVLTSKEVVNERNSKCDTPLIKLSDVSVIISSQQILKNITLEIKSGLNILTGDVGSGKSSLLKTILEEYCITNGKMRVQGTISYASQDPWLFPSSIKQNILFGQAFDKSRYDTILQVCDLSYDIEMFSNKDETIIIDKGVNLSKGQQCRINLARALYYDSDIYLLDDCLAAIDNRVKSRIFRSCVNFFKNKLCLFVTNDVNLFQEADNVVVLKYGAVFSTGKYNFNQKVFDQSIERYKNYDINNLKDDEPNKEVLDTDEETKFIDDIKPENSNIYHENKKEGKVDIKTYIRYIQAGGGFAFFTLIALSCFIAESLNKFGDKLMSIWIIKEEVVANNTITQLSNNTSVSFFTNISYFNIYATVTLGCELMHVFYLLLIFAFVLRASKEIHKLMVNGIMGSVISFFDLHMSGNILNRFTTDLQMVDENLFNTVRSCLNVLFSLIGLLILISTIDLWFLVFSITLGTWFVIFCIFVIPTARSLKRLEAAAYSPIVGHLSTTFDGLITIRSCKTQLILAEEFDKHQDYHTSVQHIGMAASRGFILFLHWFGNIFLVAIVSRFLMTDKANLAGTVGLTMGQAIRISMIFEWCIGQFIHLERQMTNVERVFEYSNVKQENQIDSDLNDNNTWPKSGEIKFENVSLFYRKNEPVLNNLNFTIKPKEKIGVVGRTGAGKSSIISSLFRLYEIEGTVLIDDLDTKAIALKRLRNNISIIPQDPQLFRGTIRDNMDPLRNYTDEEIWSALNTVNLKPLVVTLTDDIEKHDFTLGQKQLICLARCILNKTKIVVLDEATASMDEKMDNMVQTKIEEIFTDCTMIIVAHRLQNVMNCDRVMVLDDGSIVEFDNPTVLLQDSKSAFYRMVHEKI